MDSQTFNRFNRALKVAIVDSRRTQRWIARRTRIDETRLSRIISCQAHPFPEEKRALARVLAKSEDELFGAGAEAV